jgi:hypothetical protein
MKNNSLKRRLPLFFLAALLLIFNSCIGVSADIQMKKDGSGRITLEYRFSRMAESIGRLDGNELWPTVPIGRADWERTAARAAGIKLVSFYDRDDKNDIVNKVVLDFDNSEALLKLLDPSGKRASVIRDNNSGRLNIILNEPVSSQINGDLLELMRQVSAGYKFKLSFAASGNSTLALTDGSENTIAPPPGANIVSSGKKVSLEIDTGEILRMSDGLGVSFAW